MTGTGCRRRTTGHREGGESEMYRTIDTALWTDPKVRKLTSTGKLLFVYLITNSHAHVSGIYYLPIPTILFELGLSEIGYRKGIEGVSSPGLVRIDEKTSVVWVKNMLHYQGGRASGEKLLRAAANNLDNLHNSCLIEEFLQRYPQVKPYRIDRVSKGYPALDGFGTKEQEQEQDTPPTPSNGQDTLSETESVEGKSRRIVDHYQSVVKPTHTKARGVKNVSALLRKGRTEAELVRAADGYASACEFGKTQANYRLAVGNFYGEAAGYEEYLEWQPEKTAATMTPEELEQHRAQSQQEFLSRPYSPEG